MRYRSLIALAGSIGFTALLLEGGLAIVTRLDLIPIKTPSYSLASAFARQRWQDINPDFGVWHQPNIAVNFARNCFDVKYRTNSVGARDEERSITSNHERVIVLGDSFMEGLGVEANQRVSDLLQAATGIEHLNFATGGTFGTTQYYLTYKTLAKKFEHSAVLIGVLPTNDFLDNDYEYGKKAYPDRYRPYFVGMSPDYHLVYFQNSLKKSEFRELDTLLEQGKRLLSEFSFSYNFLAYAKLYITPSQPRKIHENIVTEEHSESALQKRKIAYSGYFDFQNSQADLLEFTLLKIREEAGSRPVIVALLPSAGDFSRALSHSATPLTKRLVRFGNEHGIEVVDLLDPMLNAVADSRSYFLACDPHWSVQGHAAAANAILKNVSSVYRGK
jgi:hypothetical protein